MSAPIRFEGVSKRYGAEHALHSLDLTFASGQTTALIGPSGCGKSTVLRLIAGLVEPSAGVVRVGETPVAPPHLTSLRRQMGYVIQEGGLFPHLSALDNVVLLGRHLGRDPGWLEHRVDRLRALVKLDGDALRRPPSQLSGGQRQRVALMRALILEPRVLLLDEPMGALDPLIRSELQRDLRHILDTQHITTVLVTHDLAEAARLGDQIVLLNAGRVAQVGTFSALRTSPASDFVSQFVSAHREMWEALA